MLNTALIAQIARLPHVEQVGSFTGVDPELVPLGALHEHPRPGESPPEVGGSLDGDYTALNRLAVTDGRIFDPQRTDEMVMTAAAARELGMHVGSVLPMGFSTDAQLLNPKCCDAHGTGPLAPHIKVDLRLVGIVRTNSSLLEDEWDKLQNDQLVLLSPALMRELVSCCAYYTNTDVKVADGAGNVASVVRQIERISPSLFGQASATDATLTSTAVKKAVRAIEPEAIAVGVFGVLAALATVLIAAQLIGRQLRRGAADRSVLRALGASTAVIATDGLLGVVIAIGLGVLLAAAGAVAVSPLATLGPVRAVRAPGFAVDWTVLGAGVAAFATLLAVIAIGSSVRQLPPRA